MRLQFLFVFLTLNTTKVFQNCVFHSNNIILTFSSFKKIRQLTIWKVKLGKIIITTIIGLWCITTVPFWLLVDRIPIRGTHIHHYHDCSMYLFSVFLIALIKTFHIPTCAYKNLCTVYHVRINMRVYPFLLGCKW